jgi:methionyl-tRNA formyltransferase
MKVIVLAGSKTGVAALHLKRLLESGSAQVVAVVYSEGRTLNRRKFWIRKAKKAMRIGIFGVLNGFRIRKWFEYHTDYSIKDLCDEHGVSFYTTPSINHSSTEKIFIDSRADLGVSLGNGYIATRIFTIPRLGMVNIHHEILPDFQNAQSVLWALFEGKKQTGFTIHRINQQMDAGDILYVRKNEMVFGKTLQDTVIMNVHNSYKQSAHKLPEVLASFETYCLEAQPQPPGKTYTTPGFFAWLRMQKNLRRLKKSQ